MSTEPNTTPAENGSDAAAEADTKNLAAQKWDEMFGAKAPAKDSVKEPAKEPTKGTVKEPAKAPTLPSIIKTKEAPKTDAMPPAEPTVDEAKLFEGITEPAKDAKTRPDWDKVKTIAKTEAQARLKAEQELTKLRAELEKRPAAEADAATKARLAELEQANALLSERLKVHDLASHPEFQRQYIQPQQQALSELDNLIKLEGVENVDIQKLLTLDGKKFTEAASDLLQQLTPFSQTAAGDLLRKAKSLQLQQKEALSKADELRTTYQQNFAARARATFDEVAKNYQDTLMEITPAENATPEEKAEVEAYNAALRAVPAASEKLAFGQIDERSASDMAHRAARFDFLVNHAVPYFVKTAQTQLSKAHARIAELEAQVAGMTAAQPKVGGDTNGEGGGGGGGGGEEGPRSGESTKDFAARKARGLFKA